MKLPPFYQDGKSMKKMLIVAASGATGKLLFESYPNYHEVSADITELSDKTAEAFI